MAEEPAESPGAAPPYGLDAYAPAEIAERVEHYGATKAELPLFPLLMLSLVGGGFIGLGAMVQTVILGAPGLSEGAALILGGIFFAMGYLIAITAGAEVFTTNNLLAMSWAAGRVRTLRLLELWAVVLLANAVGASGLAVMVVLSGQAELFGGEVGRVATGIGRAKAAEPFLSAFFKGLLGNLLIAMALWLAMAGRSVTDKIIAPWLPLAALPIAGLEHSVGNLYYLPVALLLSEFSAGDYGPPVSGLGALRNLTAVTLGNIAGGGGLVSLTYYAIYRRPLRDGTNG